MAHFVSAGDRRRKLVLSCLVCTLAALVIGVIVGRASVPTLAQRATSVSVAGSALATRVNALTIEYEQALSGGNDTVAKGVDEPLTGIETELSAAMKGAPWITAARAKEVLDATANVRSAAAAKVSAPAFATVTSSTAKLIREVLGAR